eukprot:9045892-Pyramimonas_sp.AAC.1
MTTYVNTIRERVGLFTIAKDFDSKTGCVVKSRLIWDCRKVNLLFVHPPWVPLGARGDGATGAGRGGAAWAAARPPSRRRAGLVQSAALGLGAGG